MWLCSASWVLIQNWFISFLDSVDWCLCQKMQAHFKHLYFWVNLGVRVSALPLLPFQDSDDAYVCPFVLALQVLRHCFLFVCLFVCILFFYCLDCAISIVCFNLLTYPLILQPVRKYFDCCIFQLRGFLLLLLLFCFGLIHSCTQSHFWLHS